MFPKYIEYNKHRMKIREKLLPVLLLSIHLKFSFILREVLQHPGWHLIRHFLMTLVDWKILGCQ